MSNLTVGKIVNNSLTLVLNSNDGDRETGNGTVNFTSKDFVAGAAYKILNVPHCQGNLNTVANRVFAKSLIDEFSDERFAPVPINPVVAVGEYYVVTATANAAGGLQGWVGVTATTNLSSSVFGTPAAGAARGTQNIANAIAASPDLRGLVVRVTLAGQLSPGNLGYKIKGPGDIITRSNRNFADVNAITAAFANFEVERLKTPTGVGIDLDGVVGPAEDHTFFRFSLPNIAAFPHKTRCLCQVVAVRHQSIQTDLHYNGGLVVRIPQMGGQSVYLGKEMMNGVLGVVMPNGQTVPSGRGTTHNTTSSLLDSATMCQSPFGKRLDVSLLDAVTLNRPTHNALRTNPIVVVLRLLFLDNEDLKDF